MMTTTQWRQAVEEAWRGRPAEERARAAAKLLRERATTAQEGPLAGEWGPSWESCDCGDGYGCSHGAWVDGVWFEGYVTERPPGQEHGDFDRHASTEIPTDAMVWMLTVQPAVGLAVAYVLEQGAGRHPEVAALADAILDAPSPNSWGWKNAMDTDLIPDELLYAPSLAIDVGLDGTATAEPQPDRPDQGPSVPIGGER